MSSNQGQRQSKCETCKLKQVYQNLEFLVQHERKRYCCQTFFMVEFSNALFSKRVVYSDFISKKGQQKVTRSSHRRCSVKKSVLENFTNFTGKHMCWILFLVKLPVFRPAALLKRDSKKVFSREICKIFKNSYFEGHLQTTASRLQITAVQIVSDKVESQLDLQGVFPFWLF